MTDTAGVYAPTLLATVEQMEDGRWFAALDGAPGCWADGDTADSALDELPDVLRGWIEVGKRFGHAELPMQVTFTGAEGIGGDRDGS